MEQQATKPNRARAGMPAMYELRVGGAIAFRDGELIDRHDNSAALCIQARRLAETHKQHYTVMEVQHPSHDFAPFGFCYTA